MNYSNSRQYIFCRLFYIGKIQKDTRGRIPSAPNIIEYERAVRMNDERGKNPQEDMSTSEILEEISRGLSEQIAGKLDFAEDNETQTEDWGRERKISTPVHMPEDYKLKTTSKRKILAAVAGGLGIVVMSVFVWLNLVVNGLLNRINYESVEDVKFADTDITDESLVPEVTAAPLVTPAPVVSERVFNVLLVGEESVYGDPVGRSDSMMIATINGKQKSLKLTSLMRDVYSAIPGYLPNKLNAAFNNGGGVLLSQTIEQNYGIPLEGYVVVNFQAFEKIIDLLGGVELELTEDEANYLNTTNYISKRANRTVVAGKQTMNGNQALGYCRVRYRTASNGESDDFGRTYRQRTVINSVFEKYKGKSVTEMLDIVNELLPYIRTNISSSDIINFVTIVASMGTTELDTFRIPADHTYMAKDVRCGVSIGDALVIDYVENIRQLKQFIYGSEDGTVKRKKIVPEVPENYIPTYETYGY